MISTTKRRLASSVLAVAAVAVFAGSALAAPSVSFLTFGTGEVDVNGTVVTLGNETGEYSGIYLKSKSLNNKPLADVDVSFNYTDSTAGGAPRFSIPLSTGSYAFIDALNSGNTGLISTNDPTAQVFINTGGSYANWDDMVAKNPTWRVAKDAIPFIIADQPGTYTLSNIDLR